MSQWKGDTIECPSRNPPNGNPSLFFYASKVRQGWKTEKKLKQPAWEEFLAVCRVLRRYGALKEADDDVETEEVTYEGSHGGFGLREPKPTAFGRMLGAINTDNELWMALILTRCVCVCIY